MSYAVPRGSYPTPFLVLWLGSVIVKSRRPKKGVGYEPLGIITRSRRYSTTFRITVSAFGLDLRRTLNQSAGPFGLTAAWVE